MPLPTTRVIPEGWSQHHRPTANGQMTATGRIEIPASPADATFDEELGRDVPGQPRTIYGPAISHTDPADGQMRVQRLNPGTTVQAVIVADREVILRQYRVSVPIDGPIEPVPVGAIVTVTSCDDEPQVVGRPLKVREVPTSTLAWDRVLICEDPAPTAR